MFTHNLKYELKILFKNKPLIFWTFAFPIILGTLFYMAFKDIENNETLKIIDIAIIENKEWNNNEIYKSTFENLSDKKNEDRLFNITYTNENNAKKLLEEESVSGYILLENIPKVIVRESGINETIITQVTEEIYSTNMMISNILSNKEIDYSNRDINIEELYKKMYEEIEKTIASAKPNIEDNSPSNLSYTMIEFYTLIAMTCIYGGILSMYALNQTLPNMSDNGKRVSIGGISKGTLILSSVLASYITQIIGLILLFVYTVFILNINYGDNLLLIIILSLAGSLAGLSLGIFVSSMFKTNEGTKIGIILAISMLGSFLSGMMGITMKYIIDKNVPIVNKLNPVNMITDGLYSLYYYDTLNRYMLNVLSLILFSGILLFISYLTLRRQSYDSI